MTTTETPARRTSFLGQLSYVIASVVVAATGVLLAIWIMFTFPAVAPMTGGDRTLPTADVRLTPAPVTPERALQGPSAPFSAPVAPAAAPLPGIAQNEATAQAMYDAAVQAGEQPQQNVDNTGDTAPVIHGQRTNDREAAGENVPTAEPVVPVTDWFGNKQKPVNIQETHTCLHGQVWNGRGCRNP